MTNKYQSYSVRDELFISNKTGSVSWKLYADNGVQSISVNKDGKTGVSISVKESYYNGKNDVTKATYIHLEAQQVDEMIAHLQKLKSQMAAQ